METVAFPRGPLAHLGDLPELLALLEDVVLELLVKIRVALSLLVVEQIPQDQDLSPQ